MALKLIIFDMDGTLVEKFTLNLLPGVRPFFDLLLRDGCEALPRIAVATNQGGVGLRYWLQQRGSAFPSTPPKTRSSAACTSWRSGWAPACIC